MGAGRLVIPPSTCRAVETRRRRSRSNRLPRILTGNLPEKGANRLPERGVWITLQLNPDLTGSCEGGGQSGPVKTLPTAFEQPCGIN
jgi:hypothetical protein